MPYNISSNMFVYSKYIVGGGSPYTTVQSAINAANAAGGGTVVVRPGLYTENLTLYDGVDIEGTVGAISIANVEIHGVHTPPAAGQIAFRTILLSSATNIFNSAAAGTTLIALEECSVNCINGYVFNLPNWAGAIFGNNIQTLSADDGFCNLTSTATIQVTNSSLGSGIANPMIISGLATFVDCSILPPQTYQTNAIVSFKSCAIGYTSTYSGNATAAAYDTNYSTGTHIAITTTSANPVSLANVIINSSAANVITGTGTVEFGSITYLNSTGVSGTIVKDFTTRFESGELKINDAVTGFLYATSGVISTAVPPSFTWSAATVNASLVVNTGIIANKAGLLTMTLPATAALGDIIRITGINTAVGWRIAQNANQQIFFGGVSSTLGVGGYIEATAIRDSVELICVLPGASTGWNVLSSIGNITVV